jgi:hypothetical protein
MKKILLLFTVLLFTATAAFSALNVTVQFDNPDFDVIAQSLGLKADIKTQVENELSKYSNMPDLTRGFANSNTYASGAATIRGYQGYDLFAVSIGTMMSVQAPSNDPTFYEDLQDDLDNGDVYAGMGANPLAGQIGLNLGFLVDDLYMSFRFGKFNTTIGEEGDDVKVEYDTSLFGILLNYQLIRQKSILAGSMLWRGFSIESGFIYTKNTTSFYKELDTFTSNSDDGLYTADVDPSVDFVIDNKSYIIPVELYTSLRLLYILNLGVGAGFDYVAGGSTKLTLESAGEAVITTPGIYQGEKGDITIDTKTREDADKFRGKVMANLGVSLGPVFIDMPATVYMDNGYSVGISAGFVW